MNEIKFIECATAEEVAEQAAQPFLDAIKANPESVFGMATGSTPLGTYAVFVREAKAKRVSFSRCATFNLDEYVGLKPKDAAHSYRVFMNNNLFGPAGFNLDRTHFPFKWDEPIKPGTDFAAYDAHIAAAGGIDVQYLGVGENGHIGFNEPGSDISSRTRLVKLAEQTIKNNSRFFDSEEDVPKEAVSMGLGSILKARKIVLVANTKNKLKAIEALRNAQAFNPEWPCTALVAHPDVTVYWLAK